MSQPAIKHIARVFLLLGAAALPNAQAYNEGGHYYTLLALYDSLASSASAEKISEIKLEAFCAELPDLAQELDAVTQRVRVLKSTRDNLWGLLGSCQTTVSAHMVATQYYLHGLAGTPAAQNRNAALQLLQATDSDLRAPKLGRAQRRQLLCARGFAGHLYGDSYAHVKLSSERAGLFYAAPHPQMYATGLGHARDGQYPDYLYGHSLDGDRWPQWVSDASAALVTGANSKPLLANLNGCADSNIANCEEEAQKKLISLLQTKNLAVANMQQLLENGNSGFAQMERTTTCDSMLAAAFPQARERPQCNQVWAYYLQKAIPVFNALGLDPGAGSNARVAHSCSAWRCSGSASYAGEQPASCAIEVRDQLEYGSQ